MKLLRLIEDSSGVAEAALSKALSTLLIDDVTTLEDIRAGDTIVCATDFSQTQVKGARNYDTSAVLLLSLKELQKWNGVHRKEFRQSDSFREQSISYKKVRDQETQLARLSSFIQCAGRINGLLVTVSMPSINVFAFTKKTDCLTHPNLEDYRQWNPKIFEKLVRTATVLSVCLRAVGRDDQKIAWLCDEDDIAANDSRRRSAESFVNQWVQNHLEVSSEIGLVLPSSRYLNDPAAAEDLLSIPDIAAGGIGDSLALFATQYGPEPIDAWISAPEDQKSKANEVARWFADPYLPLVRAAISSETDMSQAVAHQFGHNPNF